MANTSLGLDENIEGALCYVLGIITGVLFLILEKESSYVKFHAWQSILFGVAVIVINIILSILAFIPYVGILVGIISMIFSLLVLVLWLFLIWKAYSGEKYKLPIIGDYAEQYASK